MNTAYLLSFVPLCALFRDNFIHMFLFRKKKRKNLYTLQENDTGLQRQDYCGVIDLLFENTLIP